MKKQIQKNDENKNNKSSLSHRFIQAFFKFAHEISDQFEFTHFYYGVFLLFDFIQFLYFPMKNLVFVYILN